MARIIVKKHIREGTLTLALCDEDIIGKEFFDEKIVLNLKGSFYDGEVVGDKELSKLIGAAKSIHIAGKSSVDAILKIIPSFQYKEISGIPFGIIVKLI